ncbi:MAG TPA: hypothetical protein VJ508_12060, partial [Saprospiraceae bacterium]|nr:hypothetical protein [Saprospiraceae bacterium]
VADWCQLNTQYGGIWTHIQVLKVMNNIAPVISQEDDITECSFDPQCGGITLDLNAQATDDCTSPANLIWKYYIDLDNNQSFDYVSPESTGGTLAFTREFPIGLHRVLYTVRDRCGNIATEEQLIHIESCKPPSAKCIHGLSTNLMAMDTDGDGEADWGMVVMQAEMFDAGSSQACGNPFTLAFSSDPQDVTRVFDCTDIGENEVELWAIDENGLTDFCVTTVDIQDNNHICPPPGLNGTISGNITVPGSGKLAGAMVYLDGSSQPGIPTSTDGYFVFPAMPFGGQYIVRPTRDSDPKNGVTTLDLLKIQKHLLGLETFTTPYEYIAADANNSESVTAIDIIQLRKLILGIIPELPNNRSWRFIDKAHVFPDPNNPWSPTWPETYSIIPFNTNMNEVNFDAVKIGDVNRTASLQAGNGVIRPRNDNRCKLAYQVIQQPDQDVYKVDLFLESADKYQALQLSLDWDHRGYELIDWAPGSLLSAEDIHMPDDNNPKATLATYTVDNWPTGRQLLITLWVKSISKVNAPFQLFLSPSPTSPIAYEQHQDEEIGIELNQDINPENHLWNVPNPFQDMTTIFMQSNRSEAAVLHIFDLNGKLVHSRDVLLDKGEN